MNSDLPELLLGIHSQSCTARALDRHDIAEARPARVRCQRICRLIQDPAITTADAFLEECRKLPGFDHVDLWRYDSLPLYAACKAGKRKIAESITEHGKALSPPRLLGGLSPSDRTELFNAVCATGDQQFARQIHEECHAGLGKERLFGRESQRALDLACQSGDIELVRWLSSEEVAGFDKRIASATFCQALATDRPLATFLAQRFCLGKTDISTEFLQELCRAGDQDTLQWIFATFGIVETYGCIHMLLNASCNNQELGCWLLCHLDRRWVAAYADDFLSNPPRHCCLGFVRTLVESFIDTATLRRPDVSAGSTNQRSFNAPAKLTTFCRRALREGATEAEICKFASWYATKFRMTKEDVLERGAQRHMCQLVRELASIASSLAYTVVKMFEYTPEEDAIIARALANNS